MSAQQTNLTTDLTQITNNISIEGFSFEGIINNFHFIRSWWLLAFFALFLILFLLKKIRYYQSPWQHFLPKHLANALIENSQSQTTKTALATSQTRYWLKPLIIGSCIIFSLAGPAWQKLPQPVYQLERGAVLIMDMSYSMYATDVKPNRLTRARYKAIDLLKKINEGDVGLIAYAGDAFIISPLTQDVRNIELLLPSLSPDIMPVHGANAIAALTLADQTLKNAGHISGDIYWFTDDIDNEELSDVYDWSNDNNHKVNILGVGTTTGAPIKLSSGKLLKDNSGAIVIPKLPESQLSAIAQRSRGVYHTMANNDLDIKALTAHLSASIDDTLNGQTSDNSNKSDSKQAMQGDQYLEQGPWLLLIILPFILSYFRRGSSILAVSWIMPLTLLFSFTSFSPSSYAAEPNKPQTAANISPSSSTITDSPEASMSGTSQLWQDLWKTSDQQAQQHYQQKDYQKAAKQFKDSQWQGSAHYKAGEYEQALQAFKQSDTAQALYNQGNSLAQLQKVDEAIEAYKKALVKDPDLSDAKENLAKLEELKKQQEQQPQDDQENQDSKEQSGDDQQESKENKGDKQSQDGQPQDQSQDDQQQSSPENKDGEQQDEEKDSQSQEAKQKEQEQKEKDEQAAKAKASDEEQQGEEKSLAQQDIDNKAQEAEQKHQQLLNKVTDDPYLLLRNKMRLEYQKRRHEGTPQGVTKKW
jgi:Ca-activated chloride channel family protein